MRRDALWRMLGAVEQRLGRSLEALFPLKGGVQPLDVIEAVERVIADPRNRVPWRDGNIYAPNRYTIHIVCKDPGQRDFLFTFLSDAELARTVREQAQQEGYRFLSDPEFAIRIYDDAIPGRQDHALWVEPGWVGLETDEHEQATERPARARVVVEEGPDRGLQVLLRDPVAQIGRSRRMNNTLVLTDAHVSRRHLRLEVAADGSVTIENLRADDNPMEINGRPAVRATLHVGDRVRIGQTLLAIRPAQPPAAAGD